MAEDGIEQAQPNDLQAERAVLHHMLISTDAIADTVEILRGHDFFRPAHAVIYNSILTIYGANQTPNPFSVCEDLIKADQLDEAGGADYINGLARQKANSRSLAKNAERVQSTARLRRLQAAALHIHDLAADGTPEFIDRIADAAQAKIFEATAERPDSVPPAFVLGEIMEDALDQVEAIGERRGNPIGVPTGFTELDSLTGGLQPGHLTVIAARPAMGKSTLALDILRCTSIKNNLPAVLFTLESSRTEVAMRILSAESRVALHHMRSGTMTDDDWTRLARRMPDTSAAPLYVQDSSHATFTELRAQSRRLRTQRGIELIVVDDLQMFTYGTRPFSSRYEEISEISRCLKLLAKELEIPIVAVSKLNRGPEQRADKRPQVSDLRDSGALEDNADLAILLHREDAYEKDSPRAGEADLIVAKHRNGPTATITVAFQGHYSRFVDMAST
ncbi:replicative DNA helicase (plasmid) [Streptomyces yangpuensis]|uniref:Replicative DNA helicase n=1 Tax=Streptomyces yangpuensis TaxID=1648182 RepID=A0ABY5Q7U6_9ACTN|nr:replicative DNA helicase [Streptomyces yangpuensis]UUY52379.1 replicative DNA helicase [Streptomyces yangpuensis]